MSGETLSPPGNTTPSVSVIICAYNAQDFIGETLQSVLAQTWPRVEVIVVDDGSTDGTAAIVQAYGARLRYVFQPNQGSSAARNAGIALSAGAYLCFFDADDVMPPDRLARQVEFMERRPDVGLSFVDYRNFDRNGEAQQTHFQTCPRLQDLLQGRTEMVLAQACEALLHENFGITGTMLIRRDMLTREAGFAYGLRGGEDFHFYYRLARHTPVGLFCTVGMLRRLHANNMSSHRQTMLPDSIRNYTELLGSETDPQAQRLLRGKLSQAWMAYARYEANQRHFWRAIVYEHRALVTLLALPTLCRYLKNICRTLAIAVGAHTPTDR